MRTLVLYATREGQARRVAEHVTRRLHDDGATVDLYDAADVESSVDPRAYDATILVASVHLGRHEKEMVEFVRSHREALDAVPTAFLSVCLTEATVEDETQPAERREEAKREIVHLLEAFYAATAWRPTLAAPIAGALRYTKYGWLVRHLMRRIAAKQGAPTDVTRDFELTDWAALDRFIDGWFSARRTAA
ncbi:MAG: flavodoxin domain-containing protein [Deltaproteobacteria bacterium]